MQKTISKVSAAAVAGIVGMAALAPSISAAAENLEYDTENACYVMSGKTGYLNANDHGIKGERLRLNGVSGGADNIMMFKVASKDNWGICLRPSVTSGAYEGAGSIKQMNTDYWNKMDEKYKKAIGLAMYYGYPHAHGGKSQESAAYFSATQMIVWEIVLGYRYNTGATQIRPGSPKLIDYYNANEATKKAYSDINNKLAKHYNASKTMWTTVSEAKNNYSKDKTIVMKYDLKTNTYIGTYTLAKNDIAKWGDNTEKALKKLADKWNSGKYLGKDIGASVKVSETSNGDKLYTITTKNQPISSGSSNDTTGVINAKVNTSLPESWIIYSIGNNYQDVAFDAVGVDPARGVISAAVPNYGNLRIQKSFADNGSPIDKNKAISYASSVSYTIRTYDEGKDYYVQAEERNGEYIFTGTTTSPELATRFKILDPENDIDDNGTFTTAIANLPAESQGRTYVAREYVDPNSPAAKEGYPVYDDKNVYDQAFRIAGYKDGADPKNNIATTRVSFTNAIEGEYTSIGLRKYSRSYSTGEEDAIGGKFIAFVNYNDKIYFLKDLDRVVSGIYQIPKSDLESGTFKADASVLTTNIGEADLLSSHEVVGLRIMNCPIGMKFGFIEAEAETGTMDSNSGTSVPLYGYGDDVKSNKVNWSSFEETIKNYTYETDGVLVWDSDKSCGSESITRLPLFKKGREFTFTYGATSMSYAATEDMYNVPYFVDVQVIKSDKNGKRLQGAKIALYKDGEEIERVTTDENGEAVFEHKFDCKTSKADGYTYKEVTPPNGYKADDTVYDISFTHIPMMDLEGYGGQSYAHLTTIDNLPEVINSPYMGEIYLVKSDAETDEVMPGVTFELTANKDLTKEEIQALKVVSGKNPVMAQDAVKAGEVFCTVSTDDKGIIDIANLPVGTQTDSKYEYSYTATEKNMPEGFYGVGPYAFDFYTSDYSEDRSSILSTPILYSTKTAINSPEYVPLKITKKDNHNRPLEGIKFDVYAEEDVILNGRKVQSKGDKIGTLVTDATGTAKNYAVGINMTYTYDFKVYGGFDYSIVESEVTKGLVLNPEKYVFTAPFDDSGNVPEFTYNMINRWNKAKVDLVKLDSVTREALDGAVFEVWQDIDNNGEFDPEADVKLDVTMDGKGGGVYESSKELEYGAYFIKETAAPEGYIVDPNPISFNISEDGETIHVGNHTESDGTVLFLEDEIKGNVEIIKSDSETQERLSGAEFTIYEDVNQNGEYDDGDAEYGKLTENPDNPGVYNIGDVPYGKYVIKETKAPENFNPDEGVYVVNITENNQTIQVTNTENGDFVNTPMLGMINLIKFDKEYPDNKLSGAEFEVYKDINGNDQIDDEDEFMGNMSEGSDENVGVYTINGLRMGKYLVKETVAPEGFVSDENTYTVILEQDGQTVFVENEAGKGFANSPAVGSVTLTKYDSRWPDHVLSNAKFAIYKDINANGEVDGEDEYLGILPETGEGVYTMDGLRLGNYVVHETEAPEGFNLDTGFYPVIITQNGQVAEVINRDEEGDFASGFYNDVKRSDVEITKTDLATSEALPNTGIRIYNDKKEVVAEAYTDKDGKVVFKDLAYGDYYFQEFNAPEGYVLDESLYEFSIKEDGVTVKAEMKNKPITGKIVITKTDLATAETLPDTGIRVFAEDGTMVAEGYTDKDGKIVFENLTYGKYYFVEFDAPDGYMLNNDKHYFEIKEDGSVIQDGLTDEFIPKTGVTNDMVLPITAASVSAAGLAAITIVAVSRKKRKI